MEYLSNEIKVIVTSYCNACDKKISETITVKEDDFIPMPKCKKCK